MATKILSVDDELDLEVLLSQYFRRQIRKGEYEFYFAHNGIEALKVLLEHRDIEIILSDINMPEMDGLTLLTKINEMANPALKCIMVSAYGDMGNIRTAMNKGAFDFATKPIDLEDLSRTIEKAIEQVKFVRESQKEHSQLEMIKTDLAVAAEIQQSILPKQTPEFKAPECPFELGHRMKPAKDVGGDFYDFFAIDDDHLGLVVADVSGKGVPAAIFMAVSRTVIRLSGLLGIDPAACMKTSNELLCKESVENMFVTVFYAIYNVRTGELNYCSAGHNPPCLLDAAGAVHSLPVSAGMVLGIEPSVDFSAGSMTLGAGDSVVMYTDGVVEAFNPSGKQYGESRLENLLKASAGKDADAIAENILQDVHAFAAEAEQSDDITILAIRRTS